MEIKNIAQFKKALQENNLSQLKIQEWIDDELEFMLEQEVEDLPEWDDKITAGIQEIAIEKMALKNVETYDDDIFISVFFDCALILDVDVSYEDYQKSKAARNLIGKIEDDFDYYNLDVPLDVEILIVFQVNAEQSITHFELEDFNYYLYNPTQGLGTKFKK